MGPALAGRVEGAGPPSTAISMGSEPGWTVEVGLVGLAGLGRAGPSLNMAVWALRQLQQWEGEVGNQDGTGLLFPPLGQVGF